MKKLLFLPLLGMLALFSSWTVDPKTSLVLVDASNKVHELLSGNVKADVFKKEIKSWCLKYGKDTVKVNSLDFVYMPRKGDVMVYPVSIHNNHDLPAFIKQIGKKVSAGDRIVLTNMIILSGKEKLKVANINLVII